MLSRAMLDFNIMLGSERSGPFFRHIETIKELHDEQKRLAARINLFYAVTFVGALLVLSGPLPAETKVAALGFEAPLGAMPQQVIAVMMAVAYSMFGTIFASFLILNMMIGRILQAEGWEAWHFFSARFDASSLWATILMPRAVGYASPRRQRAIAYTILSTSYLAVIIHALVVMSASTVALWTAIDKGVWWLVLFGGFATLIVGVTIISLALATFAPLPFRIDLNEIESLPDKTQGIPPCPTPEAATAAQSPTP